MNQDSQRRSGPPGGPPKHRARDWRRLLESLPNWTWTATADGFIDYFSPQAASFSGVHEDELLGSGWMMRLHPDDREEAVRVWHAVFDRGAHLDIELRLRHRDGGYRWLLWRGAPGMSLGDPVVRWAGSTLDITERRAREEHTARDLHALSLVEQELREVQDRLQRAAKLSGLSMWEFVMTDRRVAHSRLLNHRALVPATTSPVTVSDYESVIDAAWIVDKDAFTAAIQACVDGETEGYEFDYRVRRDDGTINWRRSRGHVLRDPDGTPTRIVGGAIDITELKQAEAETKRANQLLHLAVRGSDIQVWDFDMPDGRLETCIPTYINVWEACRYTQAEVPKDVSSAMALVIHPEDLERMRALFQQVLGSESIDFEATYRTRQHKNGTGRWNLARGIVTRAPDGKPIRLTGASVDITQLKSAEFELQEAWRAAEAANRAKDDFLANVSHEIRTPMNAILGMTELALESSITEHQRVLLSTVKSAADNLLVVVSDLLDFAKMEAGKLELDVADFSLRSVVGETLRALAPRAHNKGLELLGDVSPDVSDRLIGDAGRLRQVLLNMVGNAVKFTHDGEVLIQVALVQGTHQGPPTVSLQFTVRDTGIGIPTDKQDRIFRAFEQEDTSTTRRFGGTGLGLAISSQLVSLMGGSVSLDSEPGRGSTFRFTARFGLQPHPAGTADILPSSRLRDLRVLVVDDNPTSRRILESWLSGWHMKPSGAGDALTAIGALWDAASLRDPYALVLLDARMPDTDGWSFAAQIRGRAGLPPLHVIMLTHAERPSDPARARELGVDAQVLKPVQPRELLGAIHGVTDRTDAEVAKAAVLSPPTHPELVTGLRILLAEDDELSARFVMQLLTARGHVVQLASDGRAALTLASQGGFDVMLLDLHMEMDGFDVAQAIRQRERASDSGRLPIAALTARSRGEDRNRCLEAGMDEFLTKPVRPADLVAAIARLAPGPPTVASARSADRGPNRLLDPVAVLSACDDNEEALRLLCRGLREYLPRRLGELTGAARTADAVGIREAAHKLSALLYAFSTTAGDVASRLEDLAAAGDLAPCAALLVRLEAMSAHLLSETADLNLEGLREEVRSRETPSV
jgi:two-component system sensor histidine kinase/response regulator